MLTLFGQILAPVLVFGVVVFVHELGHFMAAKWAGVYAPRFSIGFGRALWKRKWGETEYVIAAIPLGGYVRMASRDDEVQAKIEGGNAEELRGVAPDRLFESKPLYKRLIIMLAGVTMNLLLGIIVLTGLALAYGRPTLATRVVGRVRALAEVPTLERSIALGDTILGVDGQPVGDWNDVVEAFTTGQSATLRVRTHRGLAEIPLEGDPTLARRRLVGAVSPLLPPVIDQVVPGMPAERGRIQAGDSIVAVGGEPVASWSEVVRRIESAPGRQLRIDFIRDGVRRNTTVRPDSTTESDPTTGARRVQGKIGVSNRFPEGRAALSITEAFAAGWDETWLMSGAVLGALRDLVTREVSLKNLGGPIAIVRESSAAAKRGLEWVLRLLAFISINLAIFNLLPIPILDGGNILINIAESVKGSALSDRTREYVMRFGLAAIALLFVVVMFNDLRNIVARLFG